MMVSKMSVPLHMMLLTSLSPWRPRFNHRSVCMGFLVGRVAMQHIFLSVLQLLPVAIIPPVLHSHASITDAICTWPLTASLYDMLDNNNDSDVGGSYYSFLICVLDCSTYFLFCLQYVVHCCLIYYNCEIFVK